MIKVGLIGIIAVCFALPLKKDRPEFSALIGMIAAILISFYMVAEVSYVTECLKEILNHLPIDASYIKILFKILGITYVSEFSSGICKDAGYQTISIQIEMFAKLAILVLSIPGLQYILEIIQEFL